MAAKYEEHFCPTKFSRGFRHTLKSWEIVTSKYDRKCSFLKAPNVGNFKPALKFGNLEIFKLKILDFNIIKPFKMVSHKIFSQR